MKNPPTALVLIAMAVSIMTWGADTPPITKDRPSGRTLVRRETHVDAPGKIIWSGKSGGFKMEWTKTQFRVMAPGKSWVRVWPPPYLQGEPGCSDEYTFKLLSVVGSAVSFERTDSSRCPGTAPLTQTSWGAIDVNEPEHPLKLTDIFKEAAVYQAFRAEPLIQKSLKRSRSSPRDLASLMGSLSRLTLVFDSDDAECFASLEKLITGFSFDEPRGNSAKIRLKVELDGRKSCEEKPWELTLSLPFASRTWSKKVALAKKHQEGFLWSDAAKISSGTVSHYQADTECQGRKSAFCNEVPDNEN